MSVACREVFGRIYQTSRWASRGASRSGTGATLDATVNLRRELPRLLERFGITSLFDAGCGDLNWMSHIALPGCDYIGGDVVPSLVAELREKYAARKFVDFDITAQRFPRADLWLCRFCLNHLCYGDIAKAFRNLLNSDIRFVLFTQHLGASNADIQTGGFRRIDFTKPPFNFAPPLASIEEWAAPPPRPELSLWRVDDLRAAMSGFAG